MSDIVTLTLNPAIDKSTALEQVVPEDKLRCALPKYEPGGGGINVSRALCALGENSRVLYTAGGPQGRLLEHLLDQEGIDHRPLPVGGWTRENLTVFERGSGLQYRFGMPGPLLNALEWGDVLSAVERLEPRPRYLVLSGSLPPGAPQDGYAQIAHKTSALGVRVVVDTSGPALRYALEAGVYLAKPNLRELGQWLGEPLKDDVHLRQAAQQLVASEQAQVVVVSLGGGGALLVSAQSILKIAAPIVPIQSKVGAGDSMTAGLVYSLAKGKPLEQAARFGVAAGAAAVMTPGTQLCQKADVERLYAQMQA